MFAGRTGRRWLTIGAVAVFAQPAVGQDGTPSTIALPTAEQSDYLASKPRDSARGPGPAIIAEVEVRSLPEDSWFTTHSADQVTRQPLRSANELMILLDPTLTGPQIESALKDNDLTLISAAPQIGLVTVDASTRLGSDAVPSEAVAIEDIGETPLSLLARKLAQDKRFLAVTPNSVISAFGIKSAIVPELIAPSVSASSERIDWGINDGKFDVLWSQVSQPFTVGVVDVGFSDHEDLTTRKGLTAPISPNDHGNHVAGIMCAQHNGIGMKGALKGCTAVISAGQFLLAGYNETEREGFAPFRTRMSEYVSTILEFMEKNPEVKTINISLGYNWMPNFGIDPRNPQHAAIRNVVREQGQIFAVILAYAKRRDIALVSAAGNDSQTLSTPLEAEWASPFNFGSKMVLQLDGWTNGLVVEAHDAGRKPARFSNGAGMISCPGVDISSLLASQRNAYGKMSGTSMASPYCAAGLALVRAMRPELSLRQAIDCLNGAPVRTSRNVPIMNVEYSVKYCNVSTASEAVLDARRRGQID